ncbi:transcriptional regulator [Aphanothece hegewaldii CCALA 016]|uniref:Transcriptional regulator n=1 Tax=Aphanothece hegewaldii CCALA 016 TaxID=2107694 RepID=A0A2T1M136_9CHRO|nr:transcriptional regulator [Aphanothece hegewaldii]PSF38400.1 transcriptional regulator [Aphanothece hegewaldii CCALA 016]
MIVIDKAIYGELLVKYQPKVIDNEKEYDDARRILLELMKQKDRNPEEIALIKLIGTLIKEYDEKQEKPEQATPYEVLLHLMEENKIKQVDLVGKIGSKGVVSEIVHGKRSISKSQAKALGEFFHVSPAVFI